jgi:hypothetical protein
VCKLGFFCYEWARFKGPRVPKKIQFTQERVECNVFLFDEPLKIFKINLTFRFDKLSHVSKSVHIGENFQILTVSNKKRYSRKDDLKLTNQRSTPRRCVCRNFTLLGLYLRKNIFEIFGRLELFLKDITVKLNL